MIIGYIFNLQQVIYFHLLQSLSQFNLPVSLPRAQLVGTTARRGALLTVGAPSATLINSKGMHSKCNKPGIVNVGLGFNGAHTGSASVSGGDSYDPDQPLWNDNVPETSSALIAPHSPKIESMVRIDSFDHNHVSLCGGADNECPIRSTGIAVHSPSLNSSVWGKVGVSNNRLYVKDKTNLTVSILNNMENESKENQGVNVRGTSRQGKQINFEDSGAKTIDSPSKTQSNTMHHMPKPSQKALRTLFVNGIPQKSNRRESLLSHFQKFGEVIDIYIPLNTERAFVQFSKREEAEAALKAPDAVMGNRFIRLWWANRDSIPDDGAGSSNSVSVTPQGVTSTSFPPDLPIGNSGKDNVPATDHSKVIMTNVPKVPPPMQNQESLEQLKEELRKKQELLDQKRNDFRRQLDKLEKQVMPSVFNSEYYLPIIMSLGLLF